MKPIVSIIVPSYNTKDLLLACIDSIRKNVSLPYQLIVVDNASTDGSADLAIIKNKENIGFAKACNQGIKIAKGEYLLVLNSDTQVLKGSVEQMVKFAKENIDVGVIGAKLLNEDGSIQPSCFRLPTLMRTIRHYWLGDERLLNKYSPKGNKPSEVEAVVGAAFLIARRVVGKVGLLDERYFMYFEDLDYCRRVLKLNLKVFYLPEAKIIHYHGASGKSLAEDSLQWKRLVPSSIIYHGWFLHSLITLIIWLSQKAKNIGQ